MDDYNIICKLLSDCSIESGRVGNIYLEAGTLVVTATVILREGNYFANKHTSVQLDKNTKNHEYTNTNTKR